jgi:hypothetical protein
VRSLDWSSAVNSMTGVISEELHPANLLNGSKVFLTQPIFFTISVVFKRVGVRLHEFLMISL